MGNTKVVCSVFDPREVPNKSGYCVQGEIYCEFKFAPFSCQKRKIHQQNAEEKQYSLILQRALEPSVCLVNIHMYCQSVRRRLDKVFKFLLYLLLLAKDDEETQYWGILRLTREWPKV
ncbi:Exosome complex component MTR3 [Anthophora quadrimaculata]